MKKIIVRRRDFTIYVPPTQGESQLKRIEYRWVLHCPWCAGDGITWAKEWEHARLNALQHLTRHFRGVKLPDGKLLGMMQDENEAQQFRN